MLHRANNRIYYGIDSDNIQAYGHFFLASVI